MFNWFKKKLGIDTSLELPPSPFLSKTPAIDPNVNPLWGQIRDQAYEATFGQCDTVFHEVIPVIPHIDVFTYPPNEKRDYFTLVTGGMSDRPMTNHPDAPKDLLRAELIFYCSEPKPEYKQMLRTFAHFPHDLNTFIGDGWVIPLKGAGSVIFGHDRFTNILLLETVLKADRDMARSTILDGSALQLLAVVPITTSETNLIGEFGIDALYEKFNEFKHPVNFNNERGSYV